MRPTTEAKTVEMFMQKTELFGMGKVLRDPYTGASYVRVVEVFVVASTTVILSIVSVS